MSSDARRDMQHAVQRILEAVRGPRTSVDFDMSQQVQRLCPGRFTVLVDEPAFMPAELVNHGEAAQRDLVPPSLRWQKQPGAGEASVQQSTDLGWTEYTWQGHRVEVVTAAYATNDGLLQGRHLKWLVADSEPVARAFFLAACDAWTRARDAVPVLLHGQLSLSRSMYQAVHQSSREQLMLPDGLVDGVWNDAHAFMSSAELYRELGLPWQRSIMLQGPEGNGKRRLVRSLVKDLARPVVFVEGPMSTHKLWVDGFDGLLRLCQQNSPMVIVLEDLERDGEENFPRLGLLKRLRELPAERGVYVVATVSTIFSFKIPRFNVFDRVVHLPSPAPAMRWAYLSQHLPAGVSEDGLHTLTELSEGLSLGALRTLIRRSIASATLAGARERVVDFMLEELARLQSERGEQTVAPAPVRQRSARTLS